VFAVPRRALEITCKLRLKMKNAGVLQYALIFLVVAIVAGLLGFTALSGTAAWIAKILVVVFLVLFVISLVRGKK
jgi:uncharacterized membrane protein YtjA (UPF0391 family)